MATRDDITEQIKTRFSGVRERARVIARALKERAEIACSRRRLRAAFADLGEEVYARLNEDAAGVWQGDERLQEFRVRIDGVKAEVRQRERALAAILEGRKTSDGPGRGEPGEESSAKPSADAGEEGTT